MLCLPKFKSFFRGHPSNSNFIQQPHSSTNLNTSIPTSCNGGIHSIHLDHSYSIVNPDKANFLKFNFLSLNVCGLHSKLKYGNFESYIKPFDFICLSETKTNYIAEDEIPGFKAFFSPKKVKNGRKKKSTELGILISDRVQKFTEIIENTISDWVLWLMVGESRQNIEFILGCIYIPCQSSIYHNEFIFNDISEDLLNFQVKYDVPFILMGDYNSRTATNNDFVYLENDPSSSDVLVSESKTFKELDILKRYSMDKSTNDNGKSLLELCKTFDLRILNGRFGEDKNVGKFTCHKKNGKSVVDYILISDCLAPFVLDFKVDIFDKTLSDVHSPLCLTMQKDVQLISENPTTPDSNPTLGESRDIKNYKCRWKPGIEQSYKANFSASSIDNISSNINNTDLSDCTSEKIDSLTSDLSNLFIETAQASGLCQECNNSRPKRSYSRKHPNKPWFNKDCEMKRKEYFACKNKLRTAKTRVEKATCRRTLDLKFKEYKTFLAKRQFDFRIEIQEKLKSLKNSNSKEYWKLINSATSSSKKEGDISLNTFLEHFKKLSESKPSNNNFDPRIIDHSISEDLNADFTFEEVKKVIKRLKNNKACGIDNVSNEFLKNCPDTVIVLIVSLFNIVLKTGIVPTDWCVGIIQPLFKNKGSINSPDNYRGITLLCCIGKLFTSCMYHRLSTFFDNRVVLGEEQGGFREGYSTTNHSFVLLFIIDYYRQLGLPLYAAFIDYRKAFDLIVRACLWQKLIAENVNGNFIRVLYNLYDQAKSCVKKGGKISDFFKCTAGVRQGENLSPLLFAIYLNDFEAFLKKHYFGLTHISLAAKRELSDDDVELFFRLFVLLYADDTIVLAESELELQSALNASSIYCRDWGLTVNLTKTKIIIFSSGKITKHRNFTFNGKPVEVVDDYVYLGTTFNFNGNFSKALEKQIDLARKAMFSLLTKARRLLLPIDLQLELFEKTIVPILLYGCEVWGHTNLQPLEVFYRKFLKIVLKIGYSTPSCQVYGETGKSPLFNTVNRRLISFWIKISEDKPMKYATVIYNLMYKLHISGKFYFPWIQNIKDILYSCNFKNLWDNQSDYSTKSLLKTNIFKTLEDLYRVKWKNEVFTNQYTVIYRMYKVDLSFEKYLSLPKLSNYQRFSLVRFRTGNNKLPINKFKFSRIAQDKMCPFCNDQVGFFIGNEFHYLFECHAFAQERSIYLHSYFRTRPNTIKINKLFNSDNRKTLVNLSKFASCIMKKFQ